MGQEPLAISLRRGGLIDWTDSVDPSGLSGSVAEYAVADADSPLVARRPAALDPIKAAALPEVGLTALTLLRAADLRPGHTVLVIGASGGIGMVLLPLAAAAGVRILATAT